MAAMKIITEVQRKGVFYQAGNWKLFVAFGKDKRHRAGGPAFQEATREQERRGKAVLAAPTGSKEE